LRARQNVRRQKLLCSNKSRFHYFSHDHMRFRDLLIELIKILFGEYKQRTAFQCFKVLRAGMLFNEAFQAAGKHIFTKNKGRNLIIVFGFVIEARQTGTNKIYFLLNFPFRVMIVLLSITRSVNAALNKSHSWSERGIRCSTTDLSLSYAFGFCIVFHDD
jgi:hypothetical protein